MSMHTFRSCWCTAGAAWMRWRSRLGAFLVGQLSVQLLTFLSGLLVLRWMSEEEYAKTGVVLGFQVILAAFVDLGLGGSLVSLIGRRGQQPEVVGAYVAAARWWRHRLVAMVLPFGALAFYLINMRQGWQAGEAAMLFASIALSLHFAGVTAWASAPLLVHQRIGALYLGSNLGALIRLGGCVGLHLAGWLDAVNVALVSTVASAATAWVVRRAAAPLVEEPEHSSAAVRTEIGRFIAPLVPVAIFYAVQGQLSTLLISYFGQARSIAEFTALGRLGQIFTFLSAIFGMLVGPYFARLQPEVLRTRYAMAVIATLGMAGLITLAAFAFPAPLLWLLGQRYAHLSVEIGWLVLGSALAFAGGALWAIHSARKWVFWRGTLMYIGSVTLVQIAFLSMFGLSSTMQALHLGVATNLAALVAQAGVAFLGLRSEARSAA